MLCVVCDVRCVLYDKCCVWCVCTIWCVWWCGACCVMCVVWYVHCATYGDVKYGYACTVCGVCTVRGVCRVRGVCYVWCVVCVVYLCGLSV